MKRLESYLRIADLITRVIQRVLVCAVYLHLLISATPPK